MLMSINSDLMKTVQMTTTAVLMTHNTILLGCLTLNYLELCEKPS